MRNEYADKRISVLFDMVDYFTGYLSRIDN